ncbi:exonuclease III [Pseudoalteromonas luteoviolacea]|uniref:Exonuclease III n=1 Tax=Pseudoalteromonas luteoviolacea TaxID=43657 RepID=A0A1C0TU96_9GAMM|nr:exonuclease III [Pseudoalteromonas luteoviolacea]MBQ4812873.1 exonuclease III [Pseudoalteromonas luteoviolacea]OCQ22893.1 exonuclease III [Pseudoalteromonas luteoviolacea]
MFKSLSIATLVTIASTSAFAGGSQNFVASDASAISKVCEVAANQGLSAARKFGAQQGVFISRFSPSVECNGEDIRTFAKSHQGVQNSQQSVKAKLVAENASRATELCMKAAKEGVASLHKYRSQARGLKCNNLPVKQFVKEVKNTAI